MRSTLVLCCLALAACHTTRYVGTVPADAASEAPDAEVCPSPPSGQWTAVPSGTTSDLTAIWGTGPNDVWASSELSTSLLHFDGTQWSSVAGPEYGVAALWGSAADDVWGVGDNGAIVHWDGSAWAAVPGFEVTRYFHAVWGFGPDDVWAAGGSKLVRTVPLVAHWDGTAWSQSALPKFPESGTSFVSGLWGTSSTDLWAVGEDLLTHWDGTRWTNHDAQGTSYSRVWGSATDDVWAIGSRGGASSVLQHWDGTRWNDVTQTDSLSALWGTGRDDVWVAGSEPGGQSHIKHWNGCAWRAVPADTEVSVQALWSSGPSDVWAVGKGGAILHFAAGAQPDAGLPEAGPDAGGAGPDAGVTVCPMGWVIDGSGKCVDRICNSDGWCWEEPLPLGGGFSVIDGSDPMNLWALNGDYVLQFDGTNWRYHPEPRFTTMVRAFSRQDVWIGGPKGLWHWDGQGWERIGMNPFRLWSSGPKDLWAIERKNVPTQPDAPLLTTFSHWDGQQWSTTEQPAFKDYGKFAMCGSSSSDVWALGSATGIPSGALHWDGNAWSEKSSGLGGSEWTDALCVSSTEVWALGDSLLRWDGSAWSTVSTQLPAGAKTLAMDGTQLVVISRKGEQFVLVDGSWESRGNPGPAEETVAASAWPRLAPQWVVGGGIWRLVSGQWVRYLPSSTVGNPWGMNYSEASVFGAANQIWFAYGQQVLHFDGSAWSTGPGFVTSPISVTGTGESDLWAQAGNVLLHSDGTSWTFPPSTEAYDWARVHALGGNELWASTGSLITRWDGTGWLRPAGLEGYGRIWGTYPGNLWATGDAKLAKWNGTAWQPTTFPETFTKLPISRGPSDESLAVVGGWAYRWDGASWLKTTLKGIGTAEDAFSAGKRHWICLDRYTLSFWDGTAWSSTLLPVACGPIWGTADGVVRTFAAEGVLRRQFPTSP